MIQTNHEETPVRLGILLNPKARNTENLQKQVRKMPSDIAFYASSHLLEVPHLLEKLFWEQGVTVLGICGGDGTIHHTLHALLEIWRKKNLPNEHLPPILLLGGGTMNIFSQALRWKGTPFARAIRFWERYGFAKHKDLPLLSQPLLCVESTHYGARVGTVFGSALTARALQVYEQHEGGGYKGLALFLKEAIWGALWKTPLWQENADLLEGPAAWVQFGEEYYPYRALVASTVDIAILGGLIKGMSMASAAAGKMQVRMLGDVDAMGLMRRLPHLIFGWPDPAILDQTSALCLRLYGDFSLDGEVFRQDPAASVVVYGTTWTLPMIRAF